MGWYIFGALILIALGASNSGKKKTEDFDYFAGLNEEDDEDLDQDTDESTDSTPIHDYSCKFDNGLTSKEFQVLAEMTANRFERIVSVRVYGARIFGDVETNSGLNTWEFSANFNDNGNVTGAYSWWTENDESQIPEAYSDRLQRAINLYFSKGDGNYNSRGEFINHELLGYLKLSDIQTDYVREVFEAGLLENRQIQARKIEEEKLAQERERQEKERQERIRIEAEAKEVARLKYLEEKRLEELRKLQIKRERTVRFWKNYGLPIFFLTVVVIVLFYWGLTYSRYQKLIEVTFNNEELIGLNYQTVKDKLERAGFTNIHEKDTSDLNGYEIDQEFSTYKIRIENKEEFSTTDLFPYDAKITIYYHSVIEIIAPGTSKDYKNKMLQYTQKQFEDAGFINIKSEGLNDLVFGIINREGEVAEVSIEGNTQYGLSTFYRPDTEVIIYYHSFEQHN